MRHSKTRLILLILLALSLAMVMLASQPAPVDAATCPSIGCGNWGYFGCCGSHLYQQRTCCNGPTCCNQYRCTSSPCYF
jgi:hypothetical protein